MSLTTESARSSKRPPSDKTSDSLQAALWMAEAALDKKAEGVKILDLGAQSSFADYFVICSGSSDRQVRAIVDSITENLRKKGVPVRSSEGVREGRWIVVDCGDVIAHVFLDAIRGYYNLEGLWANAESVPLPAGSYGTAATQSS